MARSTLRCTACGVAIPPFALQKPEETKTCTQCRTVLTFTKASRLEIAVEGASLPPKPPGVSVERGAGPASYRDNAAGAPLVIRWKPPPDPHFTAWMLGLFAGMLFVGVLGGLFLSDACWPWALCPVVLLPLMLFASYSSVGEVRVDATAIRSHRRGRRKALDVPRAAVVDFRLVEIGGEAADLQVWALLTDGTEEPAIRGLPGGVAGIYIVALLRRELGLPM